MCMSFMSVSAWCGPVLSEDLIRLMTKKPFQNENSIMIKNAWTDSLNGWQLKKINHWYESADPFFDWSPNNVLYWTEV